MKSPCLTPWERSALVDRPISDQRLAQLRAEAGAFRYCLSSDVRALLERYDALLGRCGALEAELRTLRSLHPTLGAAPAVPASAAAEPRRS